MTGHDATELFRCLHQLTLATLMKSCPRGAVPDWFREEFTSENPLTLPPVVAIPENWDGYKTQFYYLYRNEPGRYWTADIPSPEILAEFADQLSKEVSRTKEVEAAIGEWELRLDAAFKKRYAKLAMRV
jgi:hypothetical protein